MKRNARPKIRNENKYYEEEIMDKNKIEQGVRLILEGIGENPEREGLLDTPDRIAIMYGEIFA